MDMAHRKAGAIDDFSLNRGDRASIVLGKAQGLLAPVDLAKQVGGARRRRPPSQADHSVSVGASFGEDCPANRRQETALVLQKALKLPPIEPADLTRPERSHFVIGHGKKAGQVDQVSGGGHTKNLPRAIAQHGLFNGQASGQQAQSRALAGGQNDLAGFERLRRQDALGKALAHALPQRTKPIQAGDQKTVQAAGPSSARPTTAIQFS